MLILHEDLIAALGEATATPFFIYRIRAAMLSNRTGRRVLCDNPSIISSNMSMTKLCTLPKKSVWRAYVSWPDQEGISPDTGLSLFAITRMKPAERTRFCNTYFPWAVSNGLRSKDIIIVYWEEELERDVDNLDMRWGSKDRRT